MHKKRRASGARRKARLRKYRWAGLLLLALFALLLAWARPGGGLCRREIEEPEIDVRLLTPNPYSRPGTKTEKIRGIVVHYTANPNSTALDNRNYFEGLKDSQTTKASSNFIIGLEGEIIQCVPTWEMAYASNERNKDTVSIECCHPDETGRFTGETYRSLVGLCAWLCEKFELSEGDIIRHYDVTGKNCPKYFVEDEDEWRKFKKNVGKKLR